MNIDPPYCYDVSTDQVMGRNKNVMVFFVRGLFSKWKLPIFYGFDVKLTVTLIEDILRALNDIGLIPMCFTSDNAGGNRGLWTRLGVNHEKPYFISSTIGRKVYCISDAVHLIKLLRNNLFDYRIRIGDVVVDKKLFEDLLKANTKSTIASTQIKSTIAFTQVKSTSAPSSSSI